MEERVLVFAKGCKDLANQHIVAVSREVKEQVIFSGSCHVYSMAKLLEEMGKTVDHQTIMGLINPGREIGMIISRMISLGILEYEEARERNMPQTVELKGA